MRLFFAIELPRAVQHTLGELRRAEATEYRWVDPALLHITLAFLGQQPEERLPVLQEIGSSTARASDAGVLQLGNVGSFGPRREPRVLWVGLDGAGLSALMALRQGLATELRSNSFELEDRPFAAHITLARRREGAPATRSLVWAGAPQGQPATFSMDHLTLVESRLSPRGPSYIPRLEFPLRGAV